jgi:NAD(P)-dependent dehydrogenase (short-subunit alcohol dehydrogenase family)
MNYKNVAITGHSKGLGKILYDRYIEKGCNVFGASRSNGYNLNSNDGLTRFYDQLKECDILINNAPGMFQMHILKRAFDMWKGKDKIIMNIGSRTTQFGLANAMDYGTEKAALDFFARSAQHFGERFPHVLLIRPGHFTGERTLHKKAEKIEVDHVADLVEFMIDSVSKFRILDMVVVK